MIRSILLKKYLKRFIKKGLTIGRNCYIKSRIDFGSEPYLITIGDNVRITDGVRFITHDGGVHVLRNIYPSLGKIDVFGRITVGNNVHVGINTIIMPGVTIGDNVVIGCGSVVTKDIPSNSIAAGVPARTLKTLDEYKEKISKVCVYTYDMSYKQKRTYLLRKQK